MRRATLGWAMVLVVGASAGLAAAADHPDLTGVWMAPFEVHASGYPIAAGQTPWMADSAGDPKDVKVPTIAEIKARLDASVKANHGDPTKGVPPPAPLPLNAAGEEAAKKLDPKKIEALELGCYPTNVLSRIGGGPIQIVQSPKAVAILSEGGGPGRTVFLDGRTSDNAIPMWNGHSVGRWDGDVLKVETDAIRGGFWAAAAPGTGAPLSDKAKVSEEYRLSPDGRQLILRVTFDDPTYYREPLRRMIYLDRRDDVEVTDFTCAEGKDDMIETVFEKDGAKLPTDGPAKSKKGRKK